VFISHFTFFLFKCFNDHLPEHQKFCGTKEICSEPKSKGSSPFKFEKETKIIETFGVSDTKLNDASVYSEEISEYEEVSVTEEELDEEIAYTKDFQNSAHSLNLPESIPDHVNFYNSFSDFGRGATRQIPEREEWTMEEVDLRHAEQMKREYGWETPDWVDPRLRPTPHGQVLKNMGDIVSPVTHAKVLIEKGIIAWTVPDWTNPKLRKTSRGESIKRGTPHFDQSATKK
jgi:hypothetical protein